MKEIIRLFNQYYFLDIFRLIRDIIITKILFPRQIRLIRQPAYIVGKKYITFGENFNSGVNLRIEVLDSKFVRHPIVGFDDDPKLIIGNNVNFNFNVHVGVIKEIKIGNNVLVGSNVVIIDHNHGNYKNGNQDSPFSIPKERKSIAESIVIGDNVWIAENVAILPGTVIGDGCIIGANSVVSGFYEKNQIVVGSPGKPVKKYNEDTSKWEVL
ncbi:acetyltransferase [Aquimarina sp. 2201CG14-23]|uniref:acetyltransferase n=1 Tax=Aquimarina mycalae TaxID=3040073 RepID=UPI002477D332|nr:acetyltransferase [Aquimarina sp. 2201CG14-23]MDH7446368.1 acetyltransferase [Aquimarina sp. 2201CG14-23]